MKQVAWTKSSAWIFTLLMSGLSGTATADSLVGEDRFLCAPVVAVLCTADGVCEEGPAWEFQVPQFVNVDLKRKQMSTTAASDQNRSTPLARIEREGGLIVLQGHEMERAFTLLLDEASGRATLATAADSVIVNVFGACTPAGR